MPPTHNMCKITCFPHVI